MKLEGGNLTYYNSDKVMHPRLLIFHTDQSFVVSCCCLKADGQNQHVCKWHQTAANPSLHFTSHGMRVFSHLSTFTQTLFADMVLSQFDRNSAGCRNELISSELRVYRGHPTATEEWALGARVNGTCVFL